MKLISQLALVALVAGGTASLDMQRPATADVTFSIGVGNYDYNRPCWFYYRHHLPAPHRCYNYMWRYYGPGMYVDGDFIFRDRYEWSHWRDRDDYRHWKRHEFRHDQWHDGRDGGHGDRDRRHH